MEVQVLTPSRRVFSSADASSVNVPGVLGYMGILPGHAPLISKIGSGKLEISTAKDGTVSYSINGGVVEVSHNKVTILSDSVTETESKPARAQHH